MINLIQKKMKNYITLFVFLPIVSFVNAQVSVGGKQSVEGTATVLDFNSIPANAKGIILPAVDNLTNALTSVPADNNGTFLFDRSTSRVKMYENNIWRDLSNTGTSTQIVVNTTAESTNSQGVIIGSETSTAKGVLVLESEGKAMILPKISNPHTSVKSPYPGMMCYDTVSKTLSVFNGTEWNYWK